MQAACPGKRGGRFFCTKTGSGCTIGKEKGKEAAKTIVFLPAALSARPVFMYNKIDGIWKEERE